MCIISHELLVHFVTGSCWFSIHQELEFSQTLGTYLYASNFICKLFFLK